MAWEIKKAPDVPALVAATSAALVDFVAGAGRPVSVALAGGRVARDVLSSTARTARERGVDFSRVEFFWGDERCVPPDDAESNYRLAAEALLDPLGIAPEHRHRIRGELPPIEAAAEASRILRAKVATGTAGVPVLDLVLLGMGEDAHTASLFPSTPMEVADAPEWFVPVIGPKPPPQRISMTFRTLAAAREVWVIAAGADKRPALQASLQPGSTTPLGRLLQRRENSQLWVEENLAP